VPPAFFYSKILGLFALVVYDSALAENALLQYGKLHFLVIKDG
jgi:hypothetical protein